MYSKFVSILAIIILVAPVSLFAQQKNSSPVIQKQSGDVIPSYELFNINRMSFWLRNDGLSGSARNGEAGVYFPRRLASVSKQDGIIWGARVNDNDPSKPEIRVGGQTYISSTVSGYITQTGPNPQASAAQPIYRIRRDYKDLSESSLEVILEAAEFYQIEPSEVTQKQARSIINRYAHDWHNWPGHLGAPYYDLNGNGSYDKGIDEPGLAEADQVIWMVTNDLDVNKSVAFAGSPPIGLEIQTTMWGYAGDSGTLADIAFQRYRFINHSGYQLDTMFVARWADPDIGDGENDFAGCDSILELGYVYNGTSFETPYEKVNLAPATYGYSLLQGPIRESPGDTAIYNFHKKAGFRNNTLSSFGYFASGSPARMPIQGDYEATELFFYWLNGYLPLWFGYFNPYIHGAGPFRGNPTFYPLNGEPIDQSFDVDGLEDNLSAGDRIILLTSGKFEMAPGDTQEVIYAALGGLGDTWLQSVADLKDKQHLAAAMQQDRFRNIPSRANFNWRTRYLSSSESEVVFNARIENAIDVTLRLKTPEGNPVTDLLMFDDGMHEDGAAGDGAAAALTLGTLFAFVDYMNRFFIPLNDLTQKYTVLQNALVASDRVFALLDEPEEQDPGAGLGHVHEVDGSIEFDRVTFGYEPSNPILKNISFKVSPGETIALVGATGAGKPTILGLLPRLYEVTEGTVRLDGADIRSLRRQELRREVGVVSQAVFLFEGTILENLILGRPDLTEAQALAAAAELGLDEVVARFPLGYHEPVAERGGNLSSGEKQLIAFARRLLAEPRILLLDEATAHVDSRTEELLQRALERLRQGRTVGVVAHRLSTVQDANRILVLHKAELVEQGPHAELIAAGGRYADLHQLGFSSSASS